MSRARFVTLLSFCCLAIATVTHSALADPPPPTGNCDVTVDKACALDRVATFEKACPIDSGSKSCRTYSYLDGAWLECDGLAGEIYCEAYPQTADPYKDPYHFSYAWSVVGFAQPMSSASAFSGLATTTCTGNVYVTMTVTNNVTNQSATHTTRVFCNGQ